MIVLFAVGPGVKGPLEKSFAEAAEARRWIEVTDKEGRKRVVEPYIIFSTPAKIRHLAVIQQSGYTSRPPKFPDWRNLPVSEIASLKVLDKTFEKSIAYNPFNKKVYHQLHFY